MNRRRFLSALGLGALAAPFAKHLPDTTPTTPVVEPPAPRYANGGIIEKPGVYIVGELGPEMFMPPFGAKIIKLGRPV